MKWNEQADRNRFNEMVMLAAVGAGLPVEEARLEALEQKGYVASSKVYNLTEAGRTRYKELTFEIEKVSKEAK
jgi:hypothetical protein